MGFRKCFYLAGLPVHQQEQVREVTFVGAEVPVWEFERFRLETLEWRRTYTRSFGDRIGETPAMSGTAAMGMRERVGSVGEKVVRALSGLCCVGNGVGTYDFGRVARGRD
jgi:hypothetical protein